MNLSEQTPRQKLRTRLANINTVRSDDGRESPVILQTPFIKKIMKPRVTLSRNDFDQHKIEYKTYFGIKMKPLLDFRHLFAIALLQFQSSLVHGFMNTQLIFLLRDPEYFNVPKDAQGRIINDLIFYSIIAAILFTSFVGYFYEIYGRNKTIFYSTILNGIMIFLIPLSSPIIFPWLLILRIVVALCQIVPTSHPLINDYIQRTSRGKAIAFQYIGNLMGDLISFGVILTLSEFLDYKLIFTITAGIVITISCILKFLISEPKDQEVEKQYFALQYKEVTDTEQFHKLKMKEKFKFLTKTLRISIAQNKTLIICFSGVFIIKFSNILFNIFVLLSFTSYVDRGILKSDVEVKEIIRNLNLAITICSFFIFMVAGKYADRYPFYKIIPASFLIRAVSVMAFIYMNEPYNMVTYAACFFMNIGAQLQNVFIDALFAKNLPENIRAILNSMNFLFASLGQLFFSKTGGLLYDYCGAEFPFVLVCVADIIFIKILIVTYKEGIFKQ